MQAQQPRREGFTLVELLVVMGILVLLASVTLMAFNSNRGGDRIRSAARSAQSAFLSARDRAMQAKDLRGIRLIVNTTDKICTGFQIIRPLPTLSGRASTSTSIVALTPTATLPYSGAIVVPRGTWTQYQTKGYFSNGVARVRIPGTSTGTWFRLINTAAPNSPPQFVNEVNFRTGNNNLPVDCVYFEGLISAESVGDSVFNLRSIPGPNQNPTLNSQPIEFLLADGQTPFDVIFGNEAQPMSEPVNLPSGVVIDLDYCEISGFLQGGSEYGLESTLLDFMYTPRGSIEGAVGTSGPLFFLLNDLADALSVDPDNPASPLNPIHPRNKGEKLVLAVFPSTGNVQTFPIDPTDAINNSTGAATPDGLPDDLFSFARRASAAN
jgi:prepilin-type N-terminal cleavage/methylation domain-containing protein